MTKPSWDKLYSHSRWRALRARQLAKEYLCCMCQADGRTTIATVCDHIEPHRGDMHKFWQATNLQSLCAEHHNRVKQSQEKGGSKTTLRPTIGLDGWPA